MKKLINVLTVFGILLAIGILSILGYVTWITYMPERLGGNPEIKEWKDCHTVKKTTTAEITDVAFLNYVDKVFKEIPEVTITRIKYKIGEETNPPSIVYEYLVNKELYDSLHYYTDEINRLRKIETNRIRQDTSIITNESADSIHRFINTIIDNPLLY